MTVIEDSAVFLGLTDRNPDTALREARALGADAVRMYVSWRRASPSPAQYSVPAGFDPARDGRLQLGALRPAGPVGPRHMG